MERISKLFGRKPDQLSGEAGDADESPVDSPSLPEAGNSSAGVAEPLYGLKFILPSGATKTFNSLPITLGRGAENTLVLQDESISARHALVYYDELVGDVCILDLDSLNGLFIDDLPTRKNILLDGARLRLGSVELTFRYTGYIHPG